MPLQHSSPQSPQSPQAPRRSDATRAAILAAARERFAAEGYERATIRAIAADAGIDPAMVMRYFGSKAQLFAAAADIDLRMPDPAGIPREQAGAVLTSHFFAMWEQNESLAAMLRAAATNEEAAERTRRIFAEQIGPVVAALCPRPEQAPVRAGLIASQLLGAALVRYIIRLAPVAVLDPATLTAWLAPSIQRYLTAPEP